MKILFLAANPKGTNPLQLDQEVKKIEEGLERSKLRDQFTLITKWAVDSETLRRAILREQPDIVHFSGHGEGQEGLVLVGQDDKPKPATADALAGLFEVFPNIKCVLLNACYAEVQAKGIVQHIDYVIGMRQAVRDDAAIAFATGFYDGLGYGLTIEDAFKLGRNAIQFEVASFSPTTRKAVPVNFDNVPEESTLLTEYLVPVLLKKERVENTTAPASNQAEPLAEKLRATNEVNQSEAIQEYRKRIKEFLADRELTPIEEFQLATLAKVVGLSEPMATQILQEEHTQIAQAQDSYRQVLIQTIEEGYYPFTEEINHELKTLQTELGLTDAEVEHITAPILLKYGNSVPKTFPSPQVVPSSHHPPRHKVIIGATLAALSATTVFLIITNLPTIPESPVTDSSPSTPVATFSPPPSLPTAAENERAGFQAFLDGDLSKARSYFGYAYDQYPTYHNVDALYHDLLTPDQVEEYNNATPDEKQAILRQLFQETVNKYPWGAPEDLLNEMKARLAQDT